MAKSLQDQLLKAGLIDQKKAKQVKQEKRKQAKQQPKGQVLENEAAERARLAREEKAARDRELNRQRQAELDERAVQAQIRQLIEVNRHNRQHGEVAYQFVDGTKIKKIYVTQPLFDGLTRGQLAIVKLGDGYEVVAKGVAEKIRARDESVVLVLNERKTAEVDEDDPYADYQIPDDLMW